MDLLLADRAFVVTGGTRGVGWAIVRLLLDEGAFVATCARDRDGLDRLRGELARSRPDAADRLSTLVADVRDGDQMQSFIGRALSAHGRLDGLVANAGAGVSGGVLDTPGPVWDDQFTVKVSGVLNTVRPAVEALAASDAGRVVIINGITAHRPEPTMAAVSAARAAVGNLCQSLAVSLARWNICVNAVNLGVVLTDRQRHRHADSGADVPFDQWCRDEAARRGVPLGRLGRPEEVAPVVALLLSPLASYVTGAAVDVAGGAGAHV